MPRLFGTDGVRGLANKEITAELAMQLGKAVAKYFAQTSNEKPKIFIGRDTRLSGLMLESALAAGICSAGGQAHILDVMPTPSVAYLTAHSDACAGAVISASHNPFYDNGIKFFSHEGRKLPDVVEDEIQKLVEQEISQDNPINDGIGEVVMRSGLASDYVEYVAKVADVNLRGLKVVIDCANGAAYELSPVIFRTLGAEVIVINNEPNGVNINENCGSTHLDGLRKAVLKYKADVGIAHDGDADRCLLIDEKGNDVDGDQIMLICALELMREGKLKDNALVTTVMSNIGLHAAIKNNGGKCVVTPVGDRYVLEEMLKGGYVLGGEQSGHVIFSDLVTTGDGIITATQVLRAVLKKNKPLSALANLMTRYPQVLQNVRVASKAGWQENDVLKKAIVYAEDILGENGRVLVRASGTEPLIRVMAEGPEQRQLEELVEYISQVVKKELS